MICSSCHTPMILQPAGQRWWCQGCRRSEPLLSLQTTGAGGPAGGGIPLVFPCPTGLPLTWVCGLPTRGLAVFPLVLTFLDLAWFDGKHSYA